MGSIKFHKLKIKVYNDRARTTEVKIDKGKKVSPVEVMFNPTSISVRHDNKYQKLQGTNTSGREAMYSHSFIGEYQNPYLSRSACPAGL